MLRERRGTCSIKHLFLTQVLAERFPETQPRIVHRVYRVDRKLAERLFGDVAAATIPANGMVDVHRYLTAEVAGERIVIDATLPGAKPWDGESPLPLACGAGTDHLAGPDPDSDKRALEDEHCDLAVRKAFLAVLARRRPAPAAGDQVRLVPHDPEWRACFETERDALERVLGGQAIGGIHHVGGTAVLAIPAEPAVDILVGTEGRPSSLACLPALFALGYTYAPAANGEILWLFKPLGRRSTHHLYLAPVGSERYRDDLALRELLASNLQVRIGFAWLKGDLARRFASDRGRYQAAKIELIRAVLAQIGAPPVTRLGAPP